MPDPQNEGAAPEVQTPAAAVSMVANLSTRLSNMAIAASAVGSSCIADGDLAGAKVALARADAYGDAARLVLTIARNL